MTDTARHGLSPASIETIAGLSAGLVSTAIVHPLDIIKTRLQVDATQHTVLGSSLKVLRGLLHNEGPTRLASLYRGLTPNLIGNSAGWALYFLWYRQAQDLIRSYRGYDASTQLSSIDYLSASAASGVLSAVLTNPIWVVKTRMLSTSATQAGAYPGLISGLLSIYGKEGVRGFFHGLTPTLVGVSHGALYFFAYEKLKIWRRSSRDLQTGSLELTNFDTIVASSLSKVFAGSITYPHQLVRARMQTYDPGATTVVKGLGLVGTIRSVWTLEGLLGFYKGLGPNLLRVVPSTCVTFLVYENVRYGLPRWSGNGEGMETEPI